MNTTEKYQQIAFNKVLKFIESSTRFTPKDVVIKDSACFEVSYGVNVQYEYDFAIKRTEGSGECSLGGYDVLANSEQDVLMRSKYITSNISLDSAVVNTLTSKIKNTKYSNLKKIELGEYYRRVIRNMTCSVCNGHGEESCGGCGGGGSVTVIVQHHGTVDSEHPVADYHETHEEEGCGDCGGSGIINCRKCNASGSIHSITSFELSAIPSDYELNLDDDNEHGDVKHALEKFSKLSLAHLHSDEDQHVVRLEGAELNNLYSFTCPFYIAECSVNGQEGKIVMFGKNYKVANSSGLLEILIRPDLDALKIASSETGYGKSAIKMAGKTVRRFMQSELNQIAFSNVKSGHIDYDALSTSVSESLSTAYLQEAVVAMKSVCSRIDKFHTVIFLVIGSLFALAVFLMFIKGGVFGALLLSAIVVIVAGWLKYLSLNLHMLVLGGFPLVKFAKNRSIARLKWYGWEFR